MDWTSPLTESSAGLGDGLLWEVGSGGMNRGGGWAKMMMPRPLLSR